MLALRLDNRCPAMLDLYKQSVLGQLEAALWMLRDCMGKCPPSRWAGPDSIIGKYEFWHVAYHALMFTDLFLSPNKESFELREGESGLHPAGWREFDDEYPSRRMEKEELLGYVEIIRAKLRDTLAAETAESLAAPSGFARHTFSRAELYLYSMRHVMHHTGQLSAVLRKIEPALSREEQPRWGFTGWR